MILFIFFACTHGSLLGRWEHLLINGWAQSSTDKVTCCLDFSFFTFLRKNGRYNFSIRIYKRIVHNVRQMITVARTKMLTGNCNWKIFTKNIVHFHGIVCNWVPSLSSLLVVQTISVIALPARMLERPKPIEFSHFVGNRILLCLEHFSQPTSSNGNNFGWPFSRSKKLLLVQRQCSVSMQCMYCVRSTLFCRKVFSIKMLLYFSIHLVVCS